MEPKKNPKSGSPDTAKTHIGEHLPHQNKKNTVAVCAAALLDKTSKT